MGVMFDAVNTAGLPAGGDYYGAYIDGNYVTINGVLARFPGARLARIVVRTGTHDGDFFDTEPGNPGPDAAARWVAMRRAEGAWWAGIYTMRSWWGACVQALQAIGIDPNTVPFWIADATGYNHLLGGAVSTQWLFAGTYDESNVQSSGLPGIGGGAPAPAPAPPEEPRREEDVLLRDSNEKIYLLAGGVLRWLNGDEYAIEVAYHGWKPATQLDNDLRLWQLAGERGIPADAVSAVFNGQARVATAWAAAA